MVFWQWLCDDEKSEGKGDKIMKDNGDDEYDYDYGDDDDADDCDDYDDDDDEKKNEDKCDPNLLSGSYWRLQT